MQRKPSHFGSNSHPSPSGIVRASLASIGLNGGASGRSTVDSCRAGNRAARRARRTCSGPHGGPATRTEEPRHDVTLEDRRGLGRRGRGRRRRRDRLSGRASDDAGATVPGLGPGGDACPARRRRRARSRSAATAPCGRARHRRPVGRRPGHRPTPPPRRMDTIGTKSQALVDTLKGPGIADEDIQTSGLNLWPTFGNDGSTINGYQASTNVTVTVRDVDQVGDVRRRAEGLRRRGADAGGISFSYDDPEAVLARPARRRSTTPGPRRAVRRGRRRRGR